MTLIYILHELTPADDYTKAIFMTRESAEKYLKLYEEKDAHLGLELSHYYIEERLVDE